MPALCVSAGGIRHSNCSNTGKNISFLRFSMLRPNILRWITTLIELQEVPPTVEFFRLVEGARPPQRADRAAGGTLPTRAFRYCEAATTAAALGWYVFPPINFKVFWTGTEIFWTYAGASDWYPLGAAQFPNFKAHFDELAPASVKGFSPTFLGALPEPGILQVWSGLVARTKPGWSLLVRGPSNLPRSVGYDVYEGLIETDRWFGPLFINIRLTQTGVPIEFDPNLPMFQAQPIARVAYSDATLNAATMRDFETMSVDDWAAYEQTVVRPIVTKCPRGAHAVSIRKRRQAEV